MLDLLSSHFSILSREVSLPCAKIVYIMCILVDLEERKMEFCKLHKYGVIEVQFYI